MTIPERHVTEENTLQKKVNRPPIFKTPPPKLNRRFTFLHFFVVVETFPNLQSWSTFFWTGI